jgi:hypothetical protein
MTGGGDESAASNPFLDAMESSVLAARSLRQKMGGPSMRESVGRAQLHQLHAKQRAAEEAAATETLKNYEKQEEAAQASQQLAAEPQVSGMALGSGGRPMPMHLDADAANAAMWPAGVQTKAQHAKMLALFDKLSPQTQQLLLNQKLGLTLQQAAAATMHQIQVCAQSPTPRPCASLSLQAHVSAQRAAIPVGSFCTAAFARARSESLQLQAPSSRLCTETCSPPSSRLCTASSIVLASPKAIRKVFLRPGARMPVQTGR